MADFCVVCRLPLSLSPQVRSGVGSVSRRRCNYCESLFKSSLETFRAEFNRACADGLLTPDEWQGLWARLRTSRGISPTTWREEALDYIEEDAKKFLHRVMDMAYADGHISSSEDAYFHNIVPALLLDQERAAPFYARWNQLKKFSEVRQGKLPVIKTNLHLDAGELCHFQGRAEYAKSTAKGIKMVQGQLVATSKRVHFLGADASGWSIQYDKVMRITPRSEARGKGSLTFELSVKRGAGTYHLASIEWAELVFSTIIRINKRHLLPGASGPSRHIPQHVKNAVWQCDAGRCTQCGANDYLEFDHIIPHSKGGASTVGNVQLLCRRCNNEKADRI